MDNATRASALFIAAGVGVAGLYWLRDILAPFALAVFLWLVIDGFAVGIERVARFRGRKFAPRPVALGVALIVVFMGVAATIAVVADSAADFAAKAPAYRAHLDEVISAAHQALARHFPQMDAAPTADELFSRIDPGRFLADVARATRSLVSDGVLIIIYVAFLFAAQSTFPRKMDAIFASPEARDRARKTIGSVRISIERYLWVQTLTGAVPAAISYVGLALLGLDNALFWAFLIFLISYVPTIGPIVATLVPTAFALVQFHEPWRVLAAFAVVAAPLFLAGNVIQPRLQGESMNLSTLVVLLGLALWGAMWGLPGMFLSAPLMVLLMIVLAQFASTRWIAVLLSADGRPEAGLVRSGPTAKL